MVRYSRTASIGQLVQYVLPGLMVTDRRTLRLWHYTHRLLPPRDRFPWQASRRERARLKRYELRGMAGHSQSLDTGQIRIGFCSYARGHSPALI
jgi:hypothetical protein